MKRRDDPFARRLDRHLWAQRLAYGPEAHRPSVEHLDRWHITCPRCSSDGRTAVLTEHGDRGGTISFSCSTGCPPEQIAESAAWIESFFIDQEDIPPPLPLVQCPVYGWSVRLPLDKFIEALEEAA